MRWRTAGRVAATVLAGRAVDWPAYSPGRAAPIQRSRPAPADVVAPLSAGYRWDRPTTGVLLTDGVGEIEMVGEIELASAFRPYTELSYLARPVAVTTDGPSLPEQVTPVYLHDRPGFAFDAALRDIARPRDVATARWVAKSPQYPTATPWLSGPAWPWDLTLRPVLIAAAAVAAAVGIQLTIRRASTGGDHATAHRP